ncbi:MAG: amino acid ABC transporter substrate-binding protein, partial [Actinomycetota bacterium]|nr:amino acid ABC transporter substrate-binding protein [Actinomycetota bacterium]
MTKSRVRRVGALVIGLSLVAASCGGDDDADAPAEEPAAEQPADEPSEEPAEEPAAAGNAADGVLRLGGILPETGNLAFLGPPEFAGAEL